MTEILTTGLLGLYNRINLFSTIQQNDVVDVTVFMNNISSGSSLASNRVMMTARVESMMNKGKDITPDEFLKILCKDMGRINTKKEYEELQRMFQPEFNTVTNRIGEGYRKIGNTIMLMARANNHVKTCQDLFPYEYIELLSSNGTIKED